MVNLKNNKFVWIVGTFLLLNLTVLGLSKFIIEKTTQQVIQRLKQEYSPSPYGPSFDPDKVSPDHLRVNFNPTNHEKAELNEIAIFDNSNTHGGGGVLYFSTEANKWREGWEKDRGFSN